MRSLLALLLLAACDGGLSTVRPVPAETIYQDSGQVTALLADGYVTWATRDWLSSQSTIRRFQIGGGVSTIVAHIAGLHGLVQNPNNYRLFWGDDCAIYGDDPVGKLVDLCVSSLAADGSAVYATDDYHLDAYQQVGQGSPRPLVFSTSVAQEAVVVDSQFVYYATDESQIVRASLADGTSTVLLDGEDASGVRQIHVDSTSLYFTDAPGGALIQLPKTGGKPRVVAIAAPGTSITTDPLFVYWVQDDEIRRAPVAGGPADTVLTDPDDPPTLVASDGANLYFATAGGAIRRYTP